MTPWESEDNLKGNNNASRLLRVDSSLKHLSSAINLLVFFCAGCHGPIQKEMPRRSLEDHCSMALYVLLFLQIMEDDAF